MVLKNREYYGINGFHVPSFPRAPRSARGRKVRKNKVQDNQISAFELLASLAGKLLQESESSACSNASEANDQPKIGNGIIKQDEDEQKPLKTECNYQGSCEESIYIPEFVLPDIHKKCIVEDFPLAKSDSILDHSSIVANSDSSQKVSGETKSDICKSITKCENYTGNIESYPNSGECCDDNVENKFSRQQGDDGMRTGSMTTDTNCSAKDPMELCMKFPPSINCDNEVKLPSYRSPLPSASILRYRNDVKLGIRDDDEIFSRYNKSSHRPKAFRPSLRFGERRMRKLLTSKYWKAAPKLKDCEHSNGDWVKSLYRKRKLFYSHERYQHGTLHKRRKFSDHSLVVTSDGGLSSESVCNSPEKGINGIKNGSPAVFSGENGVSSGIMGHQASFHSKDSHVKFSIKSIRVPELFIEVPETETVGSLKRTVMEALTAILGSGLRVGMLIQGKKVRDDKRTLSQTGITSKDNLDSLNFTLEPSAVQAPPPGCTDGTSGLLMSDTHKTIPRSPASPILDSGVPEPTPDLPQLTNTGNIAECSHESDCSHTDIVIDTTHPDSRALVAVPPVSPEALAVVPVSQKCRRAELAQRRTRRPFSVPEVEALVQAVEELGTGRWRDVKLRSFENADHRTYVDLKDKWKTLVHTAKIAPQQRRGEPVPQVLLDRVLGAHAYWYQHQAKQHIKNQSTMVKMAEEAHGVRNGGVERIHLI